MAGEARTGGAQGAGRRPTRTPRVARTVAGGSRRAGRRTPNACGKRRAGREQPYVRDPSRARPGPRRILGGAGATPRRAEATSRDPAPRLTRGRPGPLTPAGQPPRAHTVAGRQPACWRPAVSITARGHVPAHRGKGPVAAPRCREVAPTAAPKFHSGRVALSTRGTAPPDGGRSRDTG